MDEDWRTYRPHPSETPSAQTMRDAGFPERLAWATVADLDERPELLEGINAWWDALDVHLAAGPRGLAAWEDGVGAAIALSIIAKRLMCWRGLPAPRGLRLLPVAYVESRDLSNDEAFEKARETGTLLVGGVGAITFGVDRTVEVLCELQQVRARAGLLTLWHLAPTPTGRSSAVCQLLLKQIGSSVMLIGQNPHVG